MTTKINRNSSTRPTSWLFMLLLTASSVLAQDQDLSSPSSSPTYDAIDMTCFNTLHVFNFSFGACDDDKILCSADPIIAANCCKCKPECCNQCKSVNSEQDTEYPKVCPEPKELHSNIPAVVVYSLGSLFCLLCTLPKAFRYRDPPPTRMRQVLSERAQEKRREEIPNKFYIETIDNTKDVRPLILRKQSSSMMFKAPKEDDVTSNSSGSSDHDEEQGLPRLAVSSDSGDEEQCLSKEASSLDRDEEQGLPRKPSSLDRDEEQGLPTSSSNSGEGKGLPKVASSSDIDEEQGLSIESSSLENDTERDLTSAASSSDIDEEQGLPKETSSLESDAQQDLPTKRSESDEEQGLPSLETDEEEDLSNEADENAIGLVDQFLSYWKKKPVQSSECSICLELYKAGDTICVSKSPDCDHVFHEECISAWLSTHDHCPLCRVDLMSENSI
eukprot:scaffold763_cov98-Cylindrotheca_fusiformis.AAC.1